MVNPLTAVACLASLAICVRGAPAATSVSSSFSQGIPPASSTVALSHPTVTDRPASNDPNELAFPLGDQSADMVPIRGVLGASILGPTNPAMQSQNPDMLVPPTTDSGDVYVSVYCALCTSYAHGYTYSPNVKWPFALSHNRMQTDGWARQQNGRCHVCAVV